MLLRGSSAPYWVKSFLGLQSPLALKFSSAGHSAFLLESDRPCRALCAGARWELFRTCASVAVSQQAAWPLIGLHAADPWLWACAPGQPATDPGAHPAEVSGVGAHLGFQVWSPGH